MGKWMRLHKSKEMGANALTPRREEKDRGTHDDMATDDKLIYTHYLV